MENIYKFKKLSSFNSLIHFVTKRDVTKPLENSLALHTGQDSSIVIKNREELSSKLLDMNFIIANQTHSSNIEIIRDKRDRGWISQRSSIKNCDSLITDIQGVIVGVLTADCVPILIFDPQNRVVSAVHAGWRGTKEKITQKTVKKMIKEFESDPKDILIGIAPSIRRCCYEVDFNVAKYFLEYKDSYSTLDKKYMLDLVNINIQQLLEVGIQRENIEDSNICTSCSFNNYFSYRKTTCDGRFLSAIGLK